MRYLLALVAFWVSGCIASPATVDGMWRGGVRQGGWQAARLELHQTGRSLAGRIDVPALGLRQASVTGSIDGSRVRLQVEDAVEPLELAGSLTEGRLASPSGRKSFRGAFHFVRQTSATADSCPECLGWYEWKLGEALLISNDPEGGLRFSYLGRLSGTLLPIARHVYAVAFMDEVPVPSHTIARFVCDGAGRVTHIEMEGAKLLAGDRAPSRAAYRYRAQEIEFSSDGFRLAGSLLSPADERPHPAVVFVHGTGYQTALRSYELRIAREFLDRGIAVFTFDKRGCGRSTGDWQSASLDDLAGDVAAAVDHLARRTDILGERIGVYGFSEGGWIAPAVATRSPKVAFVIDHGGPGVPPLEDEMDDLTSGVDQLGLEGADHDIAMRVARALVDLYRGPEGLPAYRSAIDAARVRPWFAGVARRLPSGEEDVRVQWWRKRGRFDPARAWSSLRVPALVLIGEKDETMDVAKNVATYRRIQAENPRVELHVIPGAGHSLRSGGRFAADFPQLVADWILR